jgi:hypothetical protein
MRDVQSNPTRRPGYCRDSGRGTGNTHNAAGSFACDESFGKEPEERGTRAPNARNTLKLAAKLAILYLKALSNNYL